MYYRPYAQQGGTPVVRLAVRTSGEVDALVPQIVAAAQSLEVPLDHGPPCLEARSSEMRRQTAVQAPRSSLGTGEIGEDRSPDDLEAIAHARQQPIELVTPLDPLIEDVDREALRAAVTRRPALLALDETIDLRENAIRLFAGHLQVHARTFQDRLAPELVLPDGARGLVARADAVPGLVASTVSPRPGVTVMRRAAGSTRRGTRTWRTPSARSAEIASASAASGSSSWRS